MQANSGDPDQTPHSLASDLGLRYLPFSHIKDARHIWVKTRKRETVSYNKTIGAFFFG